MTLMRQKDLRSTELVVMDFFMIYIPLAYAFIILECWPIQLPNGRYDICVHAFMVRSMMSDENL